MTPSPSTPSPRGVLESLLTSSQIDPNTHPLQNPTQHTKSLFLTLHCLFPHDFLPALDILDRNLVSRVFVAGSDSGNGEDEADREEQGQLGQGQGQMQGRGYAAGDRETEVGDVKARDEAMQRPNTGPDSAQVVRAMQSHRTGRKTEVYYVRSAQYPPRTSRSRYQPRNQHPHHILGLHGKTYEVRLQAWNCTCPAFTFSALSNVTLSTTTETADVDGNAGNSLQEDGDVWDPEWRFGGLSRGADAVPVCKHLLACVLGRRGGFFGGEGLGLVEERGLGRAEMAGLGAGWGG